MGENDEKVTLECGMEISKEFNEKLISVTSKRPRMVIDKIMKDGCCTTDDLAEMGYNHAPRAKRDVVEQGIPIVMKMVKSEVTGRKMASYSLGDWEEYKAQNSLSKTQGRSNLSDKLKKKLIDENGSKCALYNEEFPEAQLQTDHRVPFEIGGDPDDMMDTSKFMLLSPSANRAKSWACEHCDNWIQKDISMCQTCYYASPKDYNHVEGKQERRLDLVYTGDDIKEFEGIVEYAEKNDISAQQAARLLIYKSLFKK